MPTLKETIRQTTKSFVQTWTTPSWTLSAAPNIALRAPECQHIMLPASLNLPTRNNAEWAEYFTRIAPLVTDSTMNIEDMLVVPEEKRSVCRTSITAMTPAGPYKNEYIWLLWFTEDGEKITRIEEFLDRKAARELLGQLKKDGLVDDH